MWMVRRWIHTCARVPSSSLYIQGLSMSNAHMHRPFPRCMYTSSVSTPLWCARARARVCVWRRAASSPHSHGPTHTNGSVFVYIPYTHALPCTPIVVRACRRGGHAPRTRPGVRACALSWARPHPRQCVRALHAAAAERRGLGSQAFHSASAFNANIGAWNTVRVTTLDSVCAASGLGAHRGRLRWAGRRRMRGRCARRCRRCVRARLCMRM
jgi:hypothetical protein